LESRNYSVLRAQKKEKTKTGHLVFVLKRMRHKLLPGTLAVVLFSGFFLPLGAQSTSRVQKQGVAIFVEKGPTVDGVLDDPVWDQSAPLSDFQQRNPEVGAPTSEFTAVRIR
jgi:hypothetical protein